MNSDEVIIDCDCAEATYVLTTYLLVVSSEAVVPSESALPSDLVLSSDSAL